MEPQSQGTISVFDLINIRVGLEQIKEPSGKIIETMSILEDHIHNFALGLSTTTQKGN
jgi:hypothetical protein